MRSKLVASLVTTVALGCLGAPAWAAQLQPTRPVSPELYSGRWYEIARTPNRMQRDCQASRFDFSNWVSGAFSAVQTCHKGEPGGPKSTITVSGHVLPASNNAKMQLGILGGLISQQYWILDHAADDAWVIMTTPNDRYVWLLSRSPVLDNAPKAAAIQRLQSLGFQLSKLAFEQQLAPH
jgi:apolipoprotein D and lipocalin family protein